MELREKLANYINDCQIQTVLEAVAEGAIKEEQLHELLDHPVLDEQHKTNSLIQNVVVPFNMQALDRNIRDRIQAGEWQVIGVGEGEDTPPFAYSIGAIEKMGGEVMFVGNIDMRSAGSIINQLISAFIEKGVTDDIGEIGRVEKTGESLRYKIHHRKLGDYTTDFLVKLPQFYPDYDLETPLYVIEIGDPENLLPGEPGYDDDLEQFSHVASTLEGELVETIDPVYQNRVSSIEGWANTGKTVALIEQMFNDLNDFVYERAILFLTEERWDTVRAYGVEEMGITQEVWDRVEVYQLFDTHKGLDLEATIKEVAGRHDVCCYFDNLFLYLESIVVDDTPIFREEKAAKFSELVYKTIAQHINVVFTHYIPRSSAQRAVSLMGWVKEHPPVLPEPGYRLLTTRDEESGKVTTTIIE